ncbi:BON domain-containing protein (plasmid) [Rhizobium leguminosarum]|nr:BON domain-containing protein [Rhizobium leguminosarum]
MPVVENGSLAGIISRRDLMRALLDVPRQCTASGDEALGTAVRSRLEAELEITPPMVNATVSNGVVTLRGRSRRSWNAQRPGWRRKASAASAAW